MSDEFAPVWRRHVWLSAFALTYLLGFTGWAVAKGNLEFIFYAAVMVLLVAFVLVLDRRVGFSTPVLWGLAVWGLLHMAGGNVPIPGSLAVDWTPHDGRTRTVLYNLRPWEWLPKFDQFVHAFGFFVATLASYESLRAATSPWKCHGRGVVIISALAGMGLGALNEVVEFAATRLMPTNVGGYENTGWDLVSNLTGCILGAALIWRRGGTAGGYLVDRPAR